MFTIREYFAAENLAEAYEKLCANKNNVVLGGLLWLKMGKKNINTAIDLSALGLNKIVETEEEIAIGGMCTLRQLETSDIIISNFDGVIQKAVENIVGIQFRNLATVGGSIYSRFGFSDLLTALLALDCHVELYKGGTIQLAEFIRKPYEKDILTGIRIKKNGCKACYQSHRNTSTDFPVLAVCISRSSGKWRISVGARPAKAALSYNAQDSLPENPTEEQIKSACEILINELSFGSNLRASSDYRRILAKVLVKRAIEEIVDGQNQKQIT